MDKIQGNIGPKNVELRIREAIVDWEKFRREAAVAAMQAIIGNDTLRNAKMKAAENLGVAPHGEVAKSAVAFADALITELKKEEK